jgi:hypothetical protein
MNSHKTDFDPAVILGIQSFLAVFWWFVTWFAYVQSSITDIGDPSLGPNTGNPIDWWWTGLSSGVTGWMAASYLATWVGYLVVALPEMIAWLVFSTGYPEFASLWFGTVGLYGSAVLYAVPPTFAMLHMLLPETAGGMAGDSSIVYY